MHRVTLYLDDKTYQWIIANWEPNLKSPAQQIKRFVTYHAGRMRFEEELEARRAKRAR